MPSFPSILKSANPFKGRTPAPAPGKSVIPLNGSSKAIDRQTLAQVYESGNYSDPGIALGPGIPPIPQPMDPTGQPRRYTYPVGANLIGAPGRGRLDYSLCQGLIDSYDLFRQAVFIRIDEIACMDFDIVPDPLVARSVKDKRDLMESSKAKIAAARLFFKKPDRVNTFQIWMRNILEDHFVFDAMTIYKRRTRGGQLYALEYLDGGLIKPMHSVQGRIPDPPETGYQQYQYGKPVFDFTRDELMYVPKNVRPRSLEGFSIVEQFVLHVNLALRFQAWNTAFFTDGNIPSRLLTAPDNWTADKIEEWQMLFDAAIAGDPAAQRKLFMVPPGVQELGGGNEGMFQYALEFSNYLIDITCVATGVTRQELGLEPGNSEGLGGSGLHDAMESVHNRRLVRLATFLADTIFTPLLQEEFGLDNFVWTWPSLEALDPQAHAELNQLMLFSGQKSLDEIWMEQGLEPKGVERFINLGGKLLFPKDLLALQEKGTLAFEQQQMAEQQQTEIAGQQQIAEHGANLQQQTAEHAAGLQQQQSEFDSGLQQQGAEHAAGLAQQQAEQGATLQQQTAEHGAGLQREAADHGAEIQQTQQAAKGEQDLAMAEHGALASQQQTQQAAQIAAQQAAQQHQYAIEQSQMAAGYAQQKALVDYHARLGLPLPAEQFSQPSMAAQPVVADPANDLAANDLSASLGPQDAPPPEIHPDSLFHPNNPAGLYGPEMAPIVQSGTAMGQPPEADGQQPLADDQTPDAGTTAPGEPSAGPEPSMDEGWLGDEAQPEGEEWLSDGPADPSAARTELDQWQRKVEKGLKVGKPPGKVKFHPNFLTPDQATMVAVGLSELVDPAAKDIRTVFKAVGGALATAP